MNPKVDVNTCKVLQKKRDFSETTDLNTLECSYIDSAYDSSKENGDMEDLFQAVKDSNNLPTVGNELKLI